MTERGYEDVWRSELPYVIAALTRRHGSFADCEDAAQLALVAAAEQWPREGAPRDPRAWLLRVASRRLVDQARQDGSRRRREERAARLDPAAERHDDEPAGTDADDGLQLMVLCCHPSLSPSSQVALTLRAVAGFTTRQVAAGFLVPEATMAQRISRAKATLAASGARFSAPTPAELPARLLAVRHAVSLIYTQGHLRSEGVEAVDDDLRGTAIDLARRLAAAVPGDPENVGLLALLLLTEARTPARLDEDGDLVPLEEQDRTVWRRDLVEEGVRLLEETLPLGPVGPFQVQAAVAAVHAEAPSHDLTDWEQVLVLYGMLERVAPSPATTIGLAAATAEVHGPEAGLRVLDGIADARNHRAHAVRGHFLHRLGDVAGAREAFTTAARLTRSIPEQRHLNRLVARLDAEA